MSRLFFIGLISLFAWCSPSQAGASENDDVLSQSIGAEESTVNEVRWYQVELLIFKQRPLSTEIAELWPKDIVLSYPDNWDILKTPDEYQVLYQKKAMVNTPFIFLDRKQFQFSGIEKKLQINRNQILFHGAWRQSLTQNLDQKAETQLTPILIQGGERFDDHYELEGSIALSLLRYLHIDTNLWLSRFVPVTVTPATSNPDTASTEIPTATTSSTTETATPLNWPELPIYPQRRTSADNSNLVTGEAATINKKYQVDEIVLNKQSRRMRSYETHYIDHPKFGILVRMTPLDTNTMLPIPPKK